MALESKEKIKDRMLKTAAKLWGYPDIEVESSFDPIVKLMLDACSYEIEKINGDMEASQARMIEKMVEVILPDALIGIRPSSGIIHAQPIDTEYGIPVKKHFICAKRITNTQTNAVENANITFSAIGRFGLKNASVAFVATNHKLFQLKESWYKDLTLLSQGSKLIQDSLWIAIEAKEGLKSLSGLNFYFDNRSEHQKELFFTLLSHATCQHLGKDIQIRSGMFEEKQFTDINIDEVSDNLFQYNQKVCNHIYKLYQKQFIHIAQPLDIDPKTSFQVPDELIEQFGETAFKQKVTGQYIWLKFEFGAGLHPETMENIFCNINSFPVINRRQHELSYKTQKYINIIPIENKDFFLDIKSILGNNSFEYHKRNLTTTDELNEGEAIIRTSGIGRFDSREAKETINYLLQVIRDETSTFSEIGGEVVAGKMKELNQVIARIEDQMKKFQHRGSNCYLMLKPKTDFETVFVEYWTSQGKLANDIRMGTKLLQENGSELQNKTITLLTSTFGGKDKLNLEEKLNLFRKYLLAKDRIVSAEDIKILASQLFGKHIKQIEVLKGVKVGTGKVDGYTRCIDVHILLKENHELTEEEINYITNDMDIQLNQQSTNLFPYRIIMHKKNLPQ